MKIPFINIGIFSTTTVTFYRRGVDSVNDFGQPIFTWDQMEIHGAMYALESPETQDEAHRYQSQDKLTVYVPKGYDHIDFTGYLVSMGGMVYKVEGNAVTYMKENTPGPFNRVVSAYSRPEESLPVLPQGG